MPVLKQKRIYRADLQANPHALYLFGDNTMRVGMGGQAGEMRGEPNAVGVATKYAPGGAAEDYFSDDHFGQCKTIMRVDLQRAAEHVADGGLVVIPLDGLGTGLSEMPARCPHLFKWLERELDGLLWLTRAHSLPHGA